VAEPLTEEPASEIRVRLRDPETRGELLSVMRRPASLALLLLALALAVGFSLLGQWQLGRAFENGAVIASESEYPLAIEAVTEPQTQTPSDAVGQLVTANGSWATEDLALLRGRLNDGVSGYWVIGHFVTETGAALAVAIGWTAEESDARAALESYRVDPTHLPATADIRYQQSEQPTVDEDLEPGGMASEMAVPSLINQWQSAGPVYAGYGTLLEAPDGLTSIYSPAPERQVQLNFLNLFYTIEWALFALIALYIWYRHMRDIAEREAESRPSIANASAGSAASRP